MLKFNRELLKRYTVALKRRSTFWLVSNRSVSSKILPFQFSRLIMSHSLQPHGLLHTRLPCPSLAPEACSNSYPSNHLILCHPLLSCLQSFPASGSFPMSLFLAADGPTFWKFSLSTSPFNEYSGLVSFRMDWLDLLAVQGFTLIGKVKGEF